MDFKLPFMPEMASSFAWEVDALYIYLVALTVFFTVLIALLVIFFAIKYRRRSPDELPRPIAGSVPLESLWSVIPFLISLTIFVWGTSIYFSLYRPPAEALDIYVVGKQWMWKFQHPEGQREINTLHVPVGRKVKLIMATEDVIHSFYVPAFRTKADVIPGRYASLWFEATKTGTYDLFCAEYCGTQHSGMIGKVIVQTPREYQAWLAGEGEGQQSMTQSGEQLFTQLGCNSCHGLESAERGPALKGIFGQQQKMTNGEVITVDHTYIRESILNPQKRVVEGFSPIMPSFQGQVSESQIQQLISYIQSLSAGNIQKDNPSASPNNKVPQPSER
jgi:cytochrome c oxidase subunit II